MSEIRKPRPKRRHQRNSAVYLTVYTMNGGQFPESVQRKLEDAVAAVVLEETENRLLISTTRG